ncbi:MAG: arsenate reductase ArsC [Spirochaetaceae bacterium]|nr:MAG: arsenate reductase ArsC [Spirochaetaceae bacterium]
MIPTRVLVICVHNSSRSQMAEEYLRKYGGDRVVVESAGIEPGSLNPVVVELLKRDGIDISGKATQSVFDLHAAGKQYDYVIAVCSPEAKEQCPIFPAEKERLHWPFPDPSAVTGSFEEKVKAVEPIRDQIREAVREFVRTRL